MQTPQIIRELALKLEAETPFKWRTQLTSRGFMIYRKPEKDEDERAAREYNTWRTICSDYFNVPFETIDNPNKNSDSVTPRHWCWYMLSVVSMVDVHAIVRLMNGGRSRVSILHGIRKIYAYTNRHRPDELYLKTYNDLLLIYQQLKP